MVGIKLRDKEEVTTETEKRKTFGTVFAITTEAGEGEEQSMGSTENATGGSPRPATQSKLPPVELGDLMLKLEQIDKKTQVWRGRP